MKRTVTILYLMLIAMSAFCAGLDDPGRLYDIPKLDGIVIDGRADDWGERGYIVDDIRRVNSPGRTLRVNARLGWNTQGILFLFELTDKDWAESADADNLWMGDSIELYMTPRKFDHNMLQWIITTGMDKRFPEMRKKLYDYRKDEELKKIEVPDIQAAVVRREDGSGCTVEVLFPGQGLAVDLALGREVGIQLVFNDARVQNVWFQGVKMWRNAHHVHRVRLAEEAGPRDIFKVVRERFFKHRLAPQVGISRRSSGYPANNQVVVKSGDTVVTNFTFRGGRYDLHLAPPPYGKPWTKLVFEVDGENVGEYKPDTDAWYERLLGNMPPKFQAAVFSETAFPSCDFSDPEKVRRLLGDYTVTRRFFNANKEEVAEAKQPGRYGAIVGIRSGKAEKNYYLTLFRMAGILPAVAAPLDGASASGTAGNAAATEDWGAAEIARATGIDERLVTENEAAVRDALSKLCDYNSAKLLAALHDRDRGIDKLSWSNSYVVRDNRWWLRLRHQLGEDIRKLSPHVFAVNTPPGYDQNPDKTYGLFWYCPGRGFVCDETWEGIRVHSAHGLFKEGSGRVAAPFLSAMAHSFWGYRPSEIMQMMEIIEVLYRLDPHRVFIAGHSGGAEHARKFFDDFPDRIVAVILMYHGPWKGRNLTGKGRATLPCGPDAAKQYFDIDRNYANIDDPEMRKNFDVFSKRTYDWINSLSRILPEEK